jgi:hypothetical protein
MSLPKTVEILKGYHRAVIVCTEADKATHSWAVPEETILGGGIIFEGTEPLDHNTYRQEGVHWHSSTAEKEPQEVSHKIAAHADLVEQAAASYKSCGPVQ